MGRGLFTDSSNIRMTQIVQTAQSQLQAQAAAVAAQQQQAYTAATLNAVSGMRAAAAYGAASVPQPTTSLTNYAVAAG